jgi:hypothetical protein
MAEDKSCSSEDILNMFAAQFGDSVQGYWFYDGDLCPCCLSRPIGEMMYNNKKAASVNAFMYRERGILIAYFLCGECGHKIIAGRPKEPTPQHKAIEQNLTAAYLKHLNSLA